MAIADRDPFRSMGWRKGRAPRAVPRQIARIREAVMLRRRLSTKALALDLGLPIGVIKYYSRQVKP